MTQAALLVLVVVLVATSGCGSRDKRPAPISDLHPPLVGATPRTGTGEYLVRPGDTLYSIAFQHGLDHRALARWNDLADPGRIQAGTTLRLAPPQAVVAGRPVREAAGPPPSAAQSPAPAWAWPVRGPVLRGFGEAGGSKGVDIGGTRGSPVRAAAAGRVMHAGDGLRGYGKLIIIKHSDALLSAYAHQDAILVGEGDQVALGQVVGRMGDSDARQVMLHFEIREHGKPVDPRKYLPD